MPESFIDQNLSAGISLLSHTNMPFNYYMETNLFYDQDYQDNREEIYEKEIQWVNEF